MEHKIKKSIVFVGRLEKDTGVLMFLEHFKKLKYYKVDFIGDGALRDECKKYGKVWGFTDPKPILKKSETCVPGGYLSYIEALKFKCKIWTYTDNPLKGDYWKDIKKVKEFPSWNEIADIYIQLWKDNS
jgi:glycosyltransferase involved in cell wall biosynthesis